MTRHVGGAPAAGREGLRFVAENPTRPGGVVAPLARHKLGLSQREFAALIGTGVGTVRKWELGTRRPSGAARTLIEVIKTEPKAVRRALKSQLAS